MTGRRQSRFLAGVRDNPLQLTAAAVALGFAVGLLLPESRRETKLVAPMAEQLKQQAREKGLGALERSKEVARQVAVEQVVDEVADVAGRLARSLNAERQS
ncbi:MAG: hypothetical protein M3198_15140 [Actinomycetota bacterium]|nr:hypothetical protein [Actinomycetota bacterium]